ncbi:MAG: GHKL domain-containing protein [Chitinophagaceae bacterium]
MENAFKFSTRDDANTIRIRLQQTGSRLIFECTNSYEHSAQEPGGGIGLANVKRRLELLYKDRYELDIRREADLYSVQLTLLL